jgi:hypothetical protein
MTADTLREAARALRLSETRELVYLKNCGLLIKAIMRDALIGAFGRAIGWRDA